MKQIVSILISFIFIVQLTAQETEVPWLDEHQLTWSDFKGTAPTQDHFDAYSKLVLTYGLSAESNQNARIIPTALFNRRDSWVKRGKKKKMLLAHEQKHFDITEIHRRKFIQALGENQPFSFDNIINEIDAIFERIVSEHGAMQKEYDAVTDHGLDRKAQNEWDRKISLLLRQTETYDQKEIDVSTN